MQRTGFSCKRNCLGPWQVSQKSITKQIIGIRRSPCLFPGNFQDGRENGSVDPRNPILGEASQPRTSRGVRSPSLRTDFWRNSKQASCARPRYNLFATVTRELEEVRAILVFLRTLGYDHFLMRSRTWHEIDITLNSRVTRSE